MALLPTPSRIPTQPAPIDELFGAEIGQIVDGLTKIDRLNLVPARKRSRKPEETPARHLQDVRVLLVKFADRLHNMRTLEYMPPTSAAASRRKPWTSMPRSPGAWACRTCARAEDLAFKTLHPEHYNAITQRLAAMELSSREIIAEIRSELEAT